MISTAHELIPHRPPMCFVDRLMECTETTAVAEACLEEEHFAVADGAVLEAALIECVAQTVAAALGQRARELGKTGAPKRGMLTSVSGFRIFVRPPAGKRLRIEIRELKRLGMILMISGVITCEQQTIATGELTLYA